MSIRAQAADGTVHNFPDGTDPAVVDRVMREYATSRSTLPAEAANGAGTLYENTPGRQARQIGARLAHFLPDVGGFVGGMVGGGAAAPTGPGAVLAGTGGAALGGATGRGAEYGIDRLLGYQTPDAGTMAANVAGAGALQGVLHGAGGMLAAPAQAAGEALMTKAIRFSPLIEKGVTSAGETARLARLAVKERIGPGLKEGAAARVREASAKHTANLLQEADAAGVTIHPQDIASEVNRTMAEIVDQPLSTHELDSMSEMIHRFFDEHPGPLKPTEVKALKRAAQRLAEPIIKRRSVRPGINPRDALEGRFNDAIATGAKRALERIQAPAAGGGTLGNAIGASEGRTSDLIGLEGMIRKADASTSGVRLAPFGPLRPLGHDTPDVRLTRPTASRIALALTDPTFQATLRQSPRLIDALLQQFLYQQPQEQP